MHSTPWLWTHPANPPTSTSDDNGFTSSCFLKLGVLKGVDIVVNIVVAKILDDRGHFGGFCGYGLLGQLDVLI